MSSNNTGIINGSINNIAFQIKYSPKILSKYVFNLISKYNFINIVSNSTNPKIRLSIFVVPNISFQGFKKAKLILKARHNLKIYKKENYIFLTDNSNLLILPYGREKATLFIKNLDNLNSVLLSERFFVFAIFELLYPYGFFYLHAAGVAKNRNKIIILGNSGEGKSTNVLRLFLEGWKYLSDDTILLKYNDKQQVMAVSVTSTLKVEKQNPILQRINYNLLKKLSFKESKESVGYYQTNIASVMQDRIIKSFVPNTILLLCFSRSEFSTLRPIKKSQIISFMIHHSTSFFLENKNVRLRNNLDMLFNLVNQTRCFILRIGNDIQDGALGLSDIIFSLKRIKGRFNNLK